MKLKMEEVATIFVALEELGDKETDIWYEIGKNIRKLKSFVQEYNEARREIQEKFSEKDKDGKIKLLLTPNGKQWIDYGKKQKNADDAMAKLNAEEAEVDIHKINIEKLKDSKGNWRYELKGNAMAPLIDTVFVNGVVKKESKNDV